MGPLVKLATMFSPTLKDIYSQSLAFGQSLPRHNDNGPGDAARHAYASARVAQEYGPMTANALGTLYELMSLGQDRRSEAMDEFNNRIGRGLVNIPPDQLQEEILGMLNEGRLKTLPKGIEEAGYRRGGLIQMKECNCGR